MATKEKESLEAGLNRSANKRGLTGKDRHRYIGGALHNMGKGRTRSGKREKVAAPAKKAHAPAAKVAAAPAKKAAPKPMPKPSPPKEKVELAVRKKGQHFSIYDKKSGRDFGGMFRTSSKARNEAKILQDEYNQGYKRSMIK